MHKKNEIEREALETYDRFVAQRDRIDNERSVGDSLADFLY